MPEINTADLNNAIQGVADSLHDILNTALSNNDVRMQSLTSVDFNAAGEAGIYGKGLQWTGEGPSKQLVYRANPDRIWTSESIDLGNGQNYMIGNRVVLSANELGSSIRSSNLTSVGTLENLRTSGDLVIDGYIHYNSDAMRLGFGTDAPNASISVVSLESEFIIDVEDTHSCIGTFTTDTLKIVTDNTPRIVIGPSGNIDIGREGTRTTVMGRLGVNTKNSPSDIDLDVRGGLRFQDKKFTVSDNKPTEGTFKQGDIVWHSDPKPTGYIGWVCIKDGTPGEWKTFGLISS